MRSISKKVLDPATGSKRAYLRSPTKPHEDEAELKKREHEEKLKFKQDLLEKEFEKELMQKSLEETTTKQNIQKLRRYLDDIADGNTKKAEQLHSLGEQINFLEDKSKDPLSSRFIGEFNGGPRNSTIAPINILADPYNLADLEQQEQALMQKHEEIDELERMEEQTHLALKKKMNELYRDNVLYKSRVYELQRALDHAEGRFKDLQPVELVAKSFETTVKQKFQEVNENVKAVQEYDENVRASIALSQRVNHSQLVESKVQLSEALIKLDEYRKLHEEYEKKLEELDSYHIRLLEQRNNTEQVSGIIEILETLEKEFINRNEGSHSASDSEFDDEPTEINRNSEMSTRSKNTQPRKSVSNKLVPNRRSSVSVKNNGQVARENTTTRNAQILMQTLNKNHIIFKIQRFSKKHEKGGVAGFAEKLINLYKNLCQQEIGLKMQYEELSRQKLKKDSDMELLMRDLQRMRASNEIILREEKLKEENAITNQEDDQDLNEEEAVAKLAEDAGVIHLGKTVSTINQVKTEGIHQTDMDLLQTRVEANQQMMFAAYSGIIDILFKLATLVLTADKQSLGIVPEDLHKIAEEAETLTKSIRGVKTADSQNPIPSENNTRGDINFTDASRLLRLETHSNLSSEFYVDTRFHLPQEINFEAYTHSSEHIIATFLNFFEGFTKEAFQFDRIIQNDIFIKNFVPPNRILGFIQEHASLDIPKAEALKRLFHESKTLTEDGENLLIERFEKLFASYSELLAKVRSVLKEGEANLPAHLKDHAGENGKNTYQVPEKLKKSQQLRVAKYFKHLDHTHPKYKAKEEESQCCFEERDVVQKQENEMETALSDEAIKKKLKGLTISMLEKKRGHFYRIKGIQYPFKSQKQIQREAETEELNRKQTTEDNLRPAEKEKLHFEAEREEMKRKEAEMTSKPQVEALSARKLQEAKTTSLTLPTSIAKRRMIENSQFLSQIHLSTINITALSNFHIIS